MTREEMEQAARDIAFTDMQLLQEASREEIENAITAATDNELLNYIQEE
jgi:hypothetical protein